MPTTSSTPKHLAMVKEYFVKNFGVPVHTIGTGGSGGSIQQYLIGQNYPGLLDGIIPGSSFADHTSVAEPILDCALIGRVAGAMKTGLTPEQRLAVSGYGSWGLCESRNGGAPNWMRAAACNASMPKDKVYDPVTNPKGVRCSLQDNEANIYGRDPKTGAAPQIFDNVGVQYGLRAFNDGKISAEQFLELNEIIGGFDADGDLGPRDLPATRGRSASLTRRAASTPAEADSARSPLSTSAATAISKATRTTACVRPRSGSASSMPMAAPRIRLCF